MLPLFCVIIHPSVPLLFSFVYLKMDIETGMLHQDGYCLNSFFVSPKFKKSITKYLLYLHTQKLLQLDKSSHK